MVVRKRKRRKNAKEYASEVQKLYGRMADVLGELRGLDSDLADKCEIKACDHLGWHTPDQYDDIYRQIEELQGNEKNLEEAWEEVAGVQKDLEEAREEIVGCLGVILENLVELFPDIDIQTLRCNLTVRGFPFAAQHVGDWDLANIHLRRRKRAGP